MQSQTRRRITGVMLLSTLAMAATCFAQKVSADRNRENGDIAENLVTIVDGVYANFQIATVPKDGGPYQFVTNLTTDAFNPDFSHDGKMIFF